MSSFGIETSAMLVELSISCWTARKLDKRVSQEVDTTSGAKSRAGNYNKNLLAGTQKLDNIVKFAANARAWHNVNTLPWSDNGLRLLPVENFLRYKERLSELEQEYNALVQDLPTGAIAARPSPGKSSAALSTACRDSPPPRPPGRHQAIGLTDKVIEPLERWLSG